MSSPANGSKKPFSLQNQMIVAASAFLTAGSSGK
jgi:hypothetical protein